MRRTGVSALLALSLVGGAAAHRLDEYLQATLIGVTRGAIDVELRLTPGVAMLPVLMATIDQDRDGRISPSEEQAYVGRVAREVELRVDGVPAPLSLIESTFPTVEAMREGLGTIVIKLRTARSGHELRFENRHLPRVSAYLVNCLAAPSDGLVVGRQERDEAQRSIEFAYSFGGAVPGARAAWIAERPFWPAAIGMLLMVRMAVLLYKTKPAVSGAAGWLVTFNLRHLAGAAREFGIRVALPRDARREGERGARCDVAKAKRLLKRAGRGNPPPTGDELD